MLRISSRCVQSGSRFLSTSATTSARSTAFRPKRDETKYGIPQKDESQLDTAEASGPKESQVDPNHPLWKFFHEGRPEHGEGGQRVSLEIPDRRLDNSGRSWKAGELRTKTFQELHELWYVCLMERNVLLTQREEARRLRLDLGNFSSHSEKLRMVQKSMARIKQVLSERRHAAKEATLILKERQRVEAERDSQTQTAQAESQP